MLDTGKLQPLQRPMSDFGRQTVLASAQGAASGGPGRSQASCTGRWKRTGESDSLDAACEAVKLGFVLRNAVKLVRIVEVEEGETHFQTKLKAGGVLDVTERYPWSGEEVSHGRRDKRRGGHVGSVERTEQGPKIKVAWGEPHAGTLFDLYQLEGERRMVQQTEMTMADGQLIKYRTVYERT